MNKSLSSTLHPSNSSDGLLWKALGRKTASAISSLSCFWGAVNLAAIAIFICAIKSPLFSNASYCQAVLLICCLVCSLNFLVHLWNYLKPMLLIPVPVSGNQQKLLSLADHECSPKSANSPSNCPTTPSQRSTTFSEMFSQSLCTPINNNGNVTLMNNSALSWQSFGSQSTIDVTSQSYSPNNSWLSNSDRNNGDRGIASNSFEYGGTTSGNSSLTSPNTSQLANSWHYVRNISSSFDSKFISSRKELDAYIAETQFKKDISAAVSDHMSPTSPSSAAGLWCGSTQHNAGESNAVITLRRNAYQQATPDPVCLGKTDTPNCADKSKDSNIKGAMRAASTWARRGVTPRQLFQFEENIRIWLSRAVVQPLVRTIDEVNKALGDIAPDLQIGSVGVEKLRKACSSQLSGVKQLSGIVPFLERAPTQQVYLVKRLRQLSLGGALSSFSWDKGGEGWTDQCPSDALLLVELFGLFMDFQLAPDPSDVDGRDFSNKHIVSTPAKPPQGADYPIIHVTQLAPPHVRIILPGEGECELGEGPKNVLHALLLFLHHLIHTQHSYIAGVNLALTGVNLAWVVSDRE